MTDLKAMAREFLEERQLCPPGVKFVSGPVAISTDDLATLLEEVRRAGLRYEQGKQEEREKWVRTVGATISHCRSPQRKLTEYVQGYIDACDEILRRRGEGGKDE